MLFNYFLPPLRPETVSLPMRPISSKSYSEEMVLKRNRKPVSHIGTSAVGGLGSDEFPIDCRKRWRSYDLLVRLEGT